MSYSIVSLTFNILVTLNCNKTMYINSNIIRKIQPNINSMKFKYMYFCRACINPSNHDVYGACSCRSYIRQTTMKSKRALTVFWIRISISGQHHFVLLKCIKYKVMIVSCNMWLHYYPFLSSNQPLNKNPYVHISTVNTAHQ